MAERKVMDSKSDYDIQKKKQEITETRSWADLHQDIIVLILNKLHFNDQVRFRAPCENWRVPTYFIKCYDPLAWVADHSGTCSGTPSDVYSFKSKLFDPYTREIHQVSNKFMHPNNPSGGKLTAYALKQGWLLLGRGCNSLFLHNPFTNKIILLPNNHRNSNYKAATFTTNNPTSFECEVLVFWSSSYPDTTPYALNVNQYSLSRDKILHWSSNLLGIMPTKLLSVKYFKGSIYCLFEKWVLKRYNLADKSWESLTTDYPEDNSPLHSIKNMCWLIKKGEELLMACPEFGWEIEKWMIFKFDFSKMSWVVERNLKSCAFFISGKIAFSVPLVEEKIEDCKLFYFDDHGQGGDGYCFKCFSFKDESNIESTEYSWINDSNFNNLSFIEPPYLRN